MKCIYDIYIYFITNLFNINVYWKSFDIYIGNISDHVALTRFLSSSYNKINETKPKCFSFWMNNEVSVTHFCESEEHTFIISKRTCAIDV